MSSALSLSPTSNVGPSSPSSSSTGRPEPISARSDSGGAGTALDSKSVTMALSGTAPLGSGPLIASSFEIIFFQLGAPSFQK